ncbi:MAG: hypothetical protein RLZZ450_7658 [Pseudomonadota bacterium]|jgi:glucose/arabinose dehydrogenase
MKFHALLELPPRLAVACGLLLTACGGDANHANGTPVIDDAGPHASDAAQPDAVKRDAGRDAGRTTPAPTDAGSSADAALSTDNDAGEANLAPDAASAPQASDAGLDAGGKPVTTNDDAGAVVVTADAGQPDAQLPLEVDAGQPDAGPPACDPTTAPAVGKLGLVSIVSGQGLGYLTEATQPPDSNDWYLVEQRGRIMVLRNGMVLPEPFLDLSGEITLVNDLIYEDRGLVSIEFAPDYASSGRFFVSITPNLGPDTNLDQLRSYRRLPSDPPKANPSTREDILTVRGSHLFDSDIRVNIHNGGRVTFGPDGMLYLAMGDGGGVLCGDSEPGATQDVSTLFGKILRLDLSKPPTYAAADNPFVSNGDPRVFHYGLRNPFRFSFDRVTGDLYLGDVGQNTYEELDYAPANAKGLNFGWAAFEGNSNLTCGRPLRAGSTHTPPIFVADRTAGATSAFSDYNAMIGGVVYRGTALPQLQGVYLFGGFAGARLGALRQCGSTTSPVTPVTKSCNANTPNEACLRSLNGAPRFTELRAIVEDHDGEIYVVANRDSLLKVVPLP